MGAGASKLPESRIPKRPSLSASDLSGLLGGQSFACDDGESVRCEASVEERFASQPQESTTTTTTISFVEEEDDDEQDRTVDRSMKEQQRGDAKEERMEPFERRWAELERREREVAEVEARFKNDLEWNRTNHELIMRELEEQATTLEEQVQIVREKSLQLDAELRELECARHEIEAERQRLHEERRLVEADRHFLQSQRASLCRRFEEVLERVTRAANM